MGSKEKAKLHTGERLNLLFVTSTLYWGGAQRVTNILANALSQRHNITVAYCFDSGRSLDFSERCEIRKLPDYDGNDPWPMKTICILKQAKALKELKKERSIDASISLGNVGNLINALSRGKERVICSERNNPKRSLGKLFFLTRLAYARADHVVFQSEDVRRMYPEQIRRKSTILKNPLPIPRPADKERKKKIVALGRLTAQKNHALLIRSFAGFHRQFPEYSLHLYGEGELEAEMRRLIDSLQLSDCVFLEGNQADVHEQIRDAEQFVLSSDYEGLSNALLECMSMGIACISTKCEGSVDVIRDGENGLLAELGDEEALTRQMCRLARDPELRQRLERQAMEDMKAFDQNVVVKDWERVIRG